jgi:hypothetical protein
MSELLASLWLLLSVNFAQVDDGSSYTVHTAVLRPQSFYASYYFHKTDNKEWGSKSMMIKQRPLGWLELNGRYIDVSSLQVVHLDSRYVMFGGWKELSVGISQEWVNNIPHTKLVWGKSYCFKTEIDKPSNKWEEALNVISSMTVPTVLEISADMLTDDFKNYDTDMRANFTMQILANVGIYTMLEIRDYKETDTIISVGLKLNL